jgi:hypothetical protein
VSLSEPTTFVTDLLITAACVVAVGLLHTRAPDGRSRYHWQRFFGTLGVASALGGTGHLLFASAGRSLLLASWIFSGVAVFMFETLSISLISNTVLRRTLGGVVACKLVAFVAYSIVSWSFTGVVVDAALGLVFLVAPLHVANIVRSRSSGSVWIVVGIFLAVLAAVTHAMRVAISEQWFNYRDVSHVILVASLLAICRGAIQDRRAGRE